MGTDHREYHNVLECIIMEFQWEPRGDPRNSREAKIQKPKKCVLGAPGLWKTSMVSWSPGVSSGLSVFPRQLAQFAQSGAQMVQDSATSGQNGALRFQNGAKMAPRRGPRRENVGQERHCNKEPPRISYCHRFLGENVASMAPSWLPNSNKNQLTIDTKID